MDQKYYGFKRSWKGQMELGIKKGPKTQVYKVKTSKPSNVKQRIVKRYLVRKKLDEPKLG